MFAPEKSLTLIISFLVLGSLILSIENESLRPKFVDLTTTGLGGYLALSIQKSKPVNTLPQNK